ncbi:MAG: hypothetical protein JNL80_08300 [Phycisphaerae bacterium]|jgi:hypothetical protein|nr:hypothetical protein [Phycisphaerae bacterium]
MNLPLDDWQFWVASAVTAVALAMALRPFWPRRGSAQGGACPGCPSGAAAQKPKRTAITIEGKRVE